MRQKIHASAAARSAASKLRVRDRELRKTFYGVALLQLYESKGLRPEQQLGLSWVNFNEFEAAAGPTDIRDLVGLDYVELDRSGAQPMIRIGSRAPKKEHSFV